MPLTLPPVLSRPRLLIGLAVAGLGGLCLAAGWWLGKLQSSALANPAQQALERQLVNLQQRQDQGAASAAEQQRLLELLIALNHKSEAITLLERLADQQPERPGLRLLLAELRRDQNDRNGAEREVRQLLNQNPDNIEALQLQALLQLDTGRGLLAISQLQAAFDQANKAPGKGQSLAIGLLLANIFQRQGQGSQAEALLIRLSADYPKDQRPLLARALLLQERGSTKAALAILAQARSLKQGINDQRLDAIAAAWGLESLRDPSPKQTPRQVLPPAGHPTP